MNKFQSLFLGATMAATTMTGVAFAPSAAMAITLTGTMTVQGPVNLGDTSNDAIESLTWTGLTLHTGKEATVSVPTLDFGNPPGRFNPNLDGLAIDAKNLTLTRVGTGTSNSEVYEFEKVISFFNFGQFVYTQEDNSTVTDFLTFDLNAGQLTRVVNPMNANIQFVSIPNTPITGVFKFGTQTIAMGEIQANQSILFGTSSGGATFNLIATGVPDEGEPIPEPLTMGGLAVGAGFGAFLKKRYAKKEKQLAKA